MDGLKISGQNGFINTSKGINDIVKPNSNSPSSIDGASGTSFADTLQNAVMKVNDLQQTADVKMQQLATGQTTDIADVKISAEKADIALRLMTSVRNKMIDAYHEIMKMQV